MSHVPTGPPVQVREQTGAELPRLSLPTDLLGICPEKLKIEVIYMHMEFFLDIIPPIITHQQKKVKVVKGRPIYFEPAELKDARRLFESNMWQFKPDEPIEGAIGLKCTWFFPIKEKIKTESGVRWKITKPDTDNIQKLLKDCMTTVGFWKDDAQVALETCGKFQSNGMAGILIEIDTLEDEQHE